MRGEFGYFVSKASRRRWHGFTRAPPSTERHRARVPSRVDPFASLKCSRGAQTGFGKEAAMRGLRGLLGGLIAVMLAAMPAPAGAQTGFDRPGGDYFSFA